MCVVSMVTDYYCDKWNRSPWGGGGIVPNTVPYPEYIPKQPKVPQITQDEIDEFRELLRRAREYDKRNNQPHCELEEKKSRIKKLAEELGIDISFVDED